MVNNPFRQAQGNIKNVQQSTEDWGKTKFKPNNKFAGKGNFKKRGGGGGGFGNRKFDNRKGSFPKKDIFNQVDRDAKPDNGTPWNRFKDEIVFKQRDEEQLAQQANMDSEDGRKVLKQREISYRKLLIEQKKQEPTQWDDFGEEGDDSKNKEKNKKSSNAPNPSANNNSNAKSKKKSKKNKAKNNHQGLDNKSKPTFKNTDSSNLKKKPKVQQLVSQELLKNFDSKKLNFEQNDKLRSAITKTTALKYGNSLKQAVADMKYQNKKKAKKINK